MRNATLCLAIALLALSSGACRKSTVSTASLQGIYSGIYYRIADTALENSHVTLTIAADSFYGTSDRPVYPLICQGKYLLSSDIFAVESPCVSAEYVLTSCIFTGNFVITEKSDSLILRKDHAGFDGTGTDFYRLKRQ